MLEEIHDHLTGPGPDERRQPAPRGRWSPPEVEDLPPLKDLTLQTGDPLDGDESLF